MIKKQSRTEQRRKRHSRQRKNISGTSEKPRLCVFRSNKHIYAQIIDDTKGTTLVSSSTMEKDLSSKLESTSNLEAARIVGDTIGKKAINQGIDTVVFDRGGYVYHGKVAALADAARNSGLKF